MLSRKLLVLPGARTSEPLMARIPGLLAPGTSVATLVTSTLPAIVPVPPSVALVCTITVFVESEPFTSSVPPPTVVVPA